MAQVPGVAEGPEQALARAASLHPGRDVLLMRVDAELAEGAWRALRGGLAARRLGRAVAAGRRLAAVPGRRRCRAPRRTGLGPGRTCELRARVVVAHLLAVAQPTRWPGAPRRASLRCGLLPCVYVGPALAPHGDERPLPLASLQARIAAFGADPSPAVAGPVAAARAARLERRRGALRARPRRRRPRPPSPAAGARRPRTLPALRPAPAPAPGPGLAAGAHLDPGPSGGHHGAAVTRSRGHPGHDHRRMGRGLGAGVVADRALAGRPAHRPADRGVRARHLSRLAPAARCARPGHRRPSTWPRWPRAWPRPAPATCSPAPTPKRWWRLREAFVAALASADATLVAPSDFARRRLCAHRARAVAAPRGGSCRTASRRWRRWPRATTARDASAPAARAGAWAPGGAARASGCWPPMLGRAAGRRRPAAAGQRQRRRTLRRPGRR